MIQAVFDQPEGRPLVLVGLSRENMKLLLAGKPILVDGKTLGTPVDVVVVGGETETDIHHIVTQAWGTPATTYTCCEKHAAAAGVPHRPKP